MEPVVNGLRSEYGDKIEFRRLDIEDGDEGQAMARKHRVSGVPTYIFLDGSEDVIFRRIGERTREQLVSDFKLLMEQ
jgi:Thioredoxin